MKETKIYVSIVNKDEPYEYRGLALFNGEILEYNDENFNYIYDFKINRLTKFNKENKIIIDFDKEEIILGENRNFIIKIVVKEKEIENDKVYIKYLIEDKVIGFIIKIGV